MFFHFSILCFHYFSFLCLLKYLSKQKHQISQMCISLQKLFIVLSQQYSPQKILPSTINLKNISLSSHALSRESCKKIKSFLIFYWVLPSHISNVYVLQITSSLKKAIFLKILNCVIEKLSGFSKFLVTDEQKQKIN